MNEERYEREDVIDLVDLFSYYARHLTAIVLVTVVAAALGLAGTKLIIHLEMQLLTCCRTCRPEQPSLQTTQHWLPAGLFWKR